MLSSKPLTALGKISYGIYLFHVPVQYALCRITTCHELFPMDILLTVVMATISFYFIESPIMARARTKGMIREALVES